MTIVSNITTGSTGTNFSSSSFSSSSSTVLAATSAITTMRPRDIQVTLKDARPNTRMYVYFDGIMSNEYCIPSGGTIGQPVFTNLYGEAVFTFRVIAGRWATGSKEIIISDVSDLSVFSIAGNVAGRATGTFVSSGTLYEYQTTVVNTTVNNYTTPITRQLPPTYIQLPPPIIRTDPLAQSFFTHGDKGGVFITSIDLFFQSKPGASDIQLPVRVELRNMVNGFPAEFDPSVTNAVAILNPSEVSVSNTALTPTTFTFPYPVYLPEDKDYCFVVLTNSSLYNLWTSKIGERSKETGRIIFDQPFVGSMFKSQNNYTWTPEQTEDIKFTLKKAEFSLSTGTLELVGTLPKRAVFGQSFTTKSGSAEIVYHSPQAHGLTASGYIDIAAQSSATYNGITAANLTGSFLIPSDGIVDDYTVKFNAGGVANKTGQIITSNIVYHVTMVNPGSGYTTVPAVTIASSSTGGTATGTAIVQDGKVVRIDIVSSGAGYTSPPVVTIAPPISGGVTASAVAVIDAIFTVSINKPTHVITPKINYYEHESTKLGASFFGTNNSFGAIAGVDFALDGVNHLKQENLILSTKNETTSLGGNKSAKLNLTFNTTNKNVSPILFGNKVNELITYSRSINNYLAQESISATAATSGLTGYTITNGGSGYASAPVVTITPAENDFSTNIVGATATAVLTSGVVTSLVIVAGSGYTRAPIISIAAPTTGTRATVAGIISPINSELNTVGNSATRYISKQISLSEVSTGIKLIASIYSTPHTSVDWYIRTSLVADSTSHSDNPWKILTCNTVRNKSSIVDEYFDYEFYLNDLDGFDTYDIKAVLTSSTKTVTPIIRNFRVITAL